MTLKSVHRMWATAVVLGTLVFAMAAAPTPARAEAMAVIVHPSTPIENLSFTEMRHVFLGDRQYWNSDMPVVLIVRAPVAPERQVVLDRIYRMTESQFKQYWIARIFRAETVSTPKVVYSNQTINELVAAIPGAISLVRADEILSGVKVVRIDGALPGEANYPLR
jgi:ABC-type phosphate transport system substrate-binding protein